MFPQKLLPPRLGSLDCLLCASGCAPSVEIEQNAGWSNHCLQPLSDVHCRSDPVALDAVGGAAVVSVPCPASGRAAAPPDVRSAYVLSVSAAPVRNH